MCNTSTIAVRGGFSQWRSDGGLGKFYPYISLNKQLYTATASWKMEITIAWFVVVVRLMSIGGNV